MKSNLKKDVLAIIQARYDSKRLPGKVLKKINHKTILEILIKRLSKSKKISKIIVACSNNKNDKKIIKLCTHLGVEYFIGSEKNVLDRFYKAAKKFKFNNIARVTADCPLIDPKIADEVIEKFFDKEVDYATNANPPTFPDGLDFEIFKFSTLKESYFKAKSQHEKEHVTPYILNKKKFKKFNLKNNQDYSSLRITLDEYEDFILIEKIIKNFKKNIHFNYEDILNFYKKNQKLFLINSKIQRNEGSSLSVGQKMWRRAKKIIPGGTMLFSKNPDLFLPNYWPAYFEKTKGCNLWDLEGKKYIDFSMMGVGTNVLGYSRKEVDDEVRKTIDKGNMSTLNSIEEILLAEKLVQIHPWSSKVRFARTGGDAAAIATRIARAASGKDKIAICGYHGWHDWYLAANLSNAQNLNSHLMSNLPIGGVQKNLKNSVYTFDYNNFDQLNKITNENDIGAVVMEVARNEIPKNKFLENVRKLTKKKNIVLIFDECTTGFRETLGGLHLKYKVNPDLVTFGKALGNGYAINAIVGTEAVMSYVNSTFISSTFWTERIGSVAALKTIEVMEKIKSWEIVTKIGLKIKKNWEYLSKKNKIKINIQGLNSIPNFNFEKNNLIYKTFISQEFLKKKMLVGNSFYVSTEHKEKLLNKYFDNLNNIFFKINNTRYFDDKKNLLDGPVCIAGLRSKN